MNAKGEDKEHEQESDTGGGGQGGEGAEEEPRLAVDIVARGQGG